MIPAMKYNIPVRVKNSYNPDHPGTGAATPAPRLLHVHLERPPQLLTRLPLKPFHCLVLQSSLPTVTTVTRW